MAALRRSTASDGQTCLCNAMPPKEAVLPYMQISDAILQHATAYCFLLGIFDK